MSTTDRATQPRASILRDTPPGPATWSAAGAAGALGIAWLATDGVILDGPGGYLFAGALGTTCAALALWHPMRASGPVQPVLPQDLRVVAGRNHDAPIPVLTCENEVSDAPIRRPTELGAAAEPAVLPGAAVSGR